ncbi:hypothetical protein PV326_002174, partial [Microctonus aethiopoides]
MGIKSRYVQVKETYKGRKRERSKGQDTRDNPSCHEQCHPPDFIAFIITLLMMLLMAAGVRKSLLFNNVLNALNLAVWVFIMAAGMFYVDSNNWSEHKGFLPYGWSG